MPTAPIPSPRHTPQVESVRRVLDRFRRAGSHTVRQHQPIVTRRPAETNTSRSTAKP
jgi:hypothetical protein